MSQDIPIERIDAGEYSTRLHIRNIDSLAVNIARLGLLEPIGVLIDGVRYKLLYGEHRLRAVKSLGWTTVPAVVHTDRQSALLIALTENLQREQLNPLEEARAFRRVLATGMTQCALAKVIGKTQSYIAQKLRLEKLPYSVAVMVQPLGWATEAHLRQILRVEAIAKECGRDKIEPGWEWLYEPQFEHTRERMKEGKPNNGVVNMVTYHQDKIAWGSLERQDGQTRMIPVQALAVKIAAIAGDWSDSQ